MRTVYLYRADDCRRGWLAYLKPPGYAGCTVTVEVEADTGAKAKLSALKAANNDWNGCRVVKVWRGDGYIWDADKFKELDGLEVVT